MAKLKSPADMKAVAVMLACPHQWGATKAVRLIDDGKPRDGDLATCSRCGTHKIKWPDGTGSMFPPDGLSNSPQK